MYVCIVVGLAGLLLVTRDKILAQGKGIWDQASEYYSLYSNTSSVGFAAVLVFH